MRLYRLKDRVLTPTDTDGPRKLPQHGQTNLRAVGPGVALTAALSVVIRRAPYGVGGLDAISYLGAATLLTIILGTAALLPIRRAFRLDVSRILQSE